VERVGDGAAVMRMKTVLCEKIYQERNINNGAARVRESKMSVARTEKDTWLLQGTVTLTVFFLRIEKKFHSGLF
jgi:hypothetical protein